MDESSAFADLGHNRSDNSLPRIIKILDRIVSAYTPGGRVARWKRERRSTTSANRKVDKKIEVPPQVEAQKASVRDILLPGGRLIPRNVAQNSLAIFLQILEAFPRFFEQTSFEGQLTLIQTMTRWSRDQVEKNTKNLLVWGFARLMHQDLPPVHSAKECRNLGFQGQAARWIRNLFICKRNRHNKRFFWGLQQGAKRACAPISEEFIEAAYEKHRKALTKPLSDLSCDLIEAERFGRRLFKGVQEIDSLPPPSNKASFRYSRAEGGKIAECKASVSSNSRMEIGLAYCQGELRRVEGSDISEQEALNNYLQSEDRRKARVQMVVEPLKARPITAGSALGGWTSMRGQREMWNHLYKLPQCKLIGEPLNEDHLRWLYRKSPKEFDTWVSGDYSAATDNLDIRLTKTLFEKYLYWSKHSDEFDVMCREMLYEQELHYPHDQSRTMQTNGQLMGSPLSFPILCAANLFGYHSAWKRYFGSQVPIPELPVLVNGDDILFRANAEFYEIWQQEVKKIGFELSVGKSYFSKEFLTVNSKLYLWRKTQPDQFDLVSFFNPAQLVPREWIVEPKEPPQTFTNQNRAGFPSALMEDGALPGRLSGVLSRSQRDLLGVYLYFNKREVEQATSGGRYNLFLHPHLGGLGVVNPRGNFRITRYQRQLASACLVQQSKAVSISGSSTLVGFVPPVCHTTAVRASVPPAPWEQPSLPSRLEHKIVRSGLNIYQHKNIDISMFRKLGDRSGKLLSHRELRTYFGTDQIACNDENNDILIDCEYGKAIGLPFGVLTKGSEAVPLPP